MKKYVFILLISLFIGILPVYAQSGCCSHHDGVVGCSNGRQLCGDGSLSPSCTCESSTTSTKSTTTSPVTSYVSGCTDSSAINYNKSANKNDGSCQYKKTMNSSEVIPFENTYEEDSFLKSNEEVVTTEGSYGLRTITYEVILDSENKELSRKEISNEITTPKVDRVIKRNTHAVEDKTATTMAKDNNKSDTSSGNPVVGFIALVIIIGGPILLYKKFFKKKFKH